MDTSSTASPPVATINEGAPWIARSTSPSSSSVRGSRRFQGYRPPKRAFEVALDESLDELRRGIDSSLQQMRAATLASFGRLEEDGEASGQDSPLEGMSTSSFPFLEQIKLSTESLNEVNVLGLQVFGEPNSFKTQSLSSLAMSVPAPTIPENNSNMEDSATATTTRSRSRSTAHRGSLRPTLQESSSRRSFSALAAILANEDGEEPTFHRTIRGSIKQRRRWCSCMCQSLRGIDGFFTCVVLLNCIYLGVSADLDVSSWKYTTLVCDSFFVTVFTVEEAHKIRSLGWRDYLLGETMAWNLLDISVTAEAWVELILLIVQYATDSVQIDRSYMWARALRLTRMLRVLRACSLPIFADLKMIFDGAVGGIKTFLWSQLLLAMPLYFVALVFRATLGDLEDGQGEVTYLFSSVPQSYFTSFRCLVAADCTTPKGEPIFVLITQTFGWAYGMVYSFLVVFFSMALFNVIVAVFVENATVASKKNHKREKRERLLNSKLFNRKAQQLTSFVVDYYQEHHLNNSYIDNNLDGLKRVQLTTHMFDELLTYPEFKSILRDLDIADEEQRDLLATLDVDNGGTVDLEEMLQGIAKLRGDSRRSDIIGVSLRVEHFMKVSEQQFDILHHSVRHLMKQMDKLDRLQSSPAPAPPVVPVNAPPVASRRARPVDRGAGVHRAIM